MHDFAYQTAVVNSSASTAWKSEAAGLITLHYWPVSTAAVYGLPELAAIFQVYLCELIEKAAYCVITSIDLRRQLHHQGEDVWAEITVLPLSGDLCLPSLTHLDLVRL